MSSRIRNIYILFLLAVISLLLTEIFSVSFLYFLTIILFLGFAVLTTYSTIEYAVSEGPDDLWKIGFLGLFGLIGLIPALSTGFFGFFGFFAYFGLKD